MLGQQSLLHALDGDHASVGGASLIDGSKGAAAEDGKGDVAGGGAGEGGLEAMPVVWVLGVGRDSDDVAGGGEDESVGETGGRDFESGEREFARVEMETGGVESEGGGNVGSKPVGAGGDDEGTRHGGWREGD